ncbi:hypothetical protein C7999DRAFT_36699 [Corynascus novoguineensis]|uniref:Uncharacterized protein n=1 Tax=Corynascus novoguineensis TaxID=1126955 RepID=A0AAN7CJ11_9PEZI|nr:hypothetical protein C7999DRAFT_36699 [Corynascus novoguineensis]
MKLSAIVFFTALTGVMATPIADGSELETRATCYHKGPCAWLNAGKCESYCAQYGKKFTFMESCSLGTKGCCCTK